MSIKLKINLLLNLSLLIFTIVISVPVTFFVTESKRSEFENSLIHAENVFYEFLENQKKNLTKQSQLILAIRTPWLYSNLHLGFRSTSKIQIFFYL